MAYSAKKLQMPDQVTCRPLTLQGKLQQTPPTGSPKRRPNNGRHFTLSSSFSPSSSGCFRRAWNCTTTSSRTSSASGGDFSHVAGYRTTAWWQGVVYTVDVRRAPLPARRVWPRSGSMSCVPCPAGHQGSGTCGGDTRSHMLMGLAPPAKSPLHSRAGRCGPDIVVL